MSNSVASNRSATTAGIDSAKVEALDTVELGWQHKALPASSHGMSAGAYVGSGVALSNFQTPLVTLDADAMDANAEKMATWCAAHGVLLAPHGKTTMAPQLWREQLDAGAWGITLANASQLRVGHAFGLRRVMVANSLTDPQAITWLAAAQGPDFSVVSWVDSMETVALQETVLTRVSGTVPLLDVIVELGAAGGRTGARTVAEALEVARAVNAATHLRLVGVGGYEGSLAHTADADALTAVRRYLGNIKELHEQFLAQDLYAAGADVIVTAGGSAYFDDVVSVLGDCAVTASTSGPERVDVIIRSGAYMVHDDGFYRGISPFSRADQETSGQAPFLSAMHAWARVVSRPEPGLAILDAGKRDMPVDEGLPEPQLLARSLGGEASALAGASISAVNDQHCFLRFDPATTTVNIGDVLRLGLSHPCTAFDKWTLIPVLANSGTDYRVVDLIHTFF
ncbi:type III PLP-dependent enzyme domain-containing protein [Arthrobacter antibioticus]|uniref:alanine racemase n=1 Tax=Arthrobacter sp. H35-MC1 TaxID=3046203 RepID=UPI0024BB5684|nr:alanine racemase [Arthrobacter sp. H35-MC1]MDJ0318235.1 alanine racemase [Arthrobacter sp. H35-MC1]